MFGTQALLCIGDLASKDDTFVPCLPMALKAVPLLAPVYGDAALHIDDSLGSVAMGLKVAPHIANSASIIAEKVDTFVHFCNIWWFDYVV